MSEARRLADPNWKYVARPATLEVEREETMRKNPDGIINAWFDDLVVEAVKVERPNRHGMSRNAAARNGVTVHPTVTRWSAIILSDGVDVTDDVTISVGLHNTKRAAVAAALDEIAENRAYVLETPVFAADDDHPALRGVTL